MFTESEVNYMRPKKSPEWGSGRERRYGYGLSCFVRALSLGCTASRCALISFECMGPRFSLKPYLIPTRHALKCSTGDDHQKADLTPSPLSCLVTPELWPYTEFVTLSVETVQTLGSVNNHNKL
ncbi:MAG: hypothetical protein QG577_1711 [Thermodesulfobacteriota bacterium]|nr:hypothetical protein [Thermodesulfobacteriota bacterium]